MVQRGFDHRRPAPVSESGSSRSRDQNADPTIRQRRARCSSDTSRRMCCEQLPIPVVLPSPTTPSLRPVGWSPAFQIPIASYIDALRIHNVQRFFRKRFFSRISATACFSCSFSWRSSVLQLKSLPASCLQPTVSFRPRETPCSTGSTGSTESLPAGTRLRCSLRPAALPTRSALSLPTSTSSSSSDESPVPDSLLTLSLSFDPSSNRSD